MRSATGASPASWPVASWKFALLLGVLAFALLLLHVRSVQPPEQRGIGVVPSEAPETGRGFVVSMGVRFKSCRRPLDVTVVVAGSAEYWIDHAGQMRASGSVDVAIPDTKLDNLKAGIGVDGKLAPSAPFTEEDLPKRLSRKAFESHIDRRRDVTILSARVRRWGRHLKPLVIRFEARWLSPRDRLGTCYLEVPALAGPATALSAQIARKEAFTEKRFAMVDCAKLTCSIIPLRSRELDLVAYYLPKFETTRGLTTVDAGSGTIRTDLSLPAPDGDVQGFPSWTCATRPPKDFSFLANTAPGDKEQFIEGDAPDASGAVSVDRLGTALTERNCASFAVFEESSAQLKRDLLLLLMGALLSVGFALVAEAAARLRPQASKPKSGPAA